MIGGGGNGGALLSPFAQQERIRELEGALAGAETAANALRVALAGAESELRVLRGLLAVKSGGSEV